MEIQKINNIIPKVVQQIGQKKDEIKKEQQDYSITKKEENIPIEMNSLELLPILNTSSEEQKEKIAKRELGKDKYIKISAPVDESLCKREDIATLLVCFLLLQHSSKRKRYSFETSYYKIASFLGDTSGREYQNIKNSLNRLVNNAVETNFWWNTVNGERIVEYNFHFLSDVSKGEKGALSISFPESVAKSMEAGYIKFLSEKGLKEILKIRSYFAKTLVLLFLKRFWDSNQRDIHVDTILKYLGIEKRYNGMPTYNKNKYIKITIIPAVQEAAKFLCFSVTYNDTGEKDGEGNPIPDPKGQEKFRFNKIQQELFAETTESVHGKNFLTSEEKNLLEKKQKEINKRIKNTTKIS